MKKLKKSLTINIQQDEHNNASSPKNLKYKQIKQRPLLLFNQHTVASSANNQDQQLEHNLNEQQNQCQQFTQFYTKNPFQPDKNQESQNKELILKNNKFQKYKKFNVVQFEEFSIDPDVNKAYNNQQSFKSESKQSLKNQKDSTKGNKRQFSIQIPQQQKGEKSQITVKFGFDLKNQNYQKKYKNNGIKQPPAPSNKAKISKSTNRHFVFPTNDEQIFLQNNQKNKPQMSIVNSKGVPEDQHNLKISQLNKQWLYKMDQISKKFEKQRQQFYKQKSNLERDLMIKDGQIQMLQKLITNRYSPKQGNLMSNLTTQPLILSQRPQIYRNSLNQKMKQSIHISSQKVNSLQTILLEKDLQINSLLQKINELNNSIDRKNDQLHQVQINLIKSQKMNQSLKNQIYLYQKKQEGQKLTKQFYKVKETLNQVHQSANNGSNQASRTPKGYSINKWDQQISKDKQKQIQIQKKQYPLRGIDDLHKRLQSLKMNRIQLESRGKIKSQVGYSQTSKNRTKGTFDFKGKFYDRDRDYINHSRMY